MRTFALALALLLALSAVASAQPSPNLCGGIDWLNSPDIPTQVRVYQSGNLPELAAILQAIQDSCESILDVELHWTGLSTMRIYNCAIVVSVKKPDCLPELSP
jgi:hypothetical protein